MRTLIGFCELDCMNLASFVRTWASAPLWASALGSALWSGLLGSADLGHMTLFPAFAAGQVVLVLGAIRSLVITVTTPPAYAIWGFVALAIALGIVDAA